MKYTEVTLKIQTLNPYRDILVYELGEGDYDSFVETPEGVKAYIPTHLFDESFLKSVLEDIDCEISYVAEEMHDKNWNEEWEKQHKSVLVEGEKSVYVRAPFHPHIEADYEIIIEPKRSFINSSSYAAFNPKSIFFGPLIVQHLLCQSFVGGGDLA